MTDYSARLDRVGSADHITPRVRDCATATDWIPCRSLHWQRQQHDERRRRWQRSTNRRTDEGRSTTS